MDLGCKAADGAYHRCTLVIRSPHMRVLRAMLVGLVQDQNGYSDSGEKISQASRGREKSPVETSGLAVRNDVAKKLRRPLRRATGETRDLKDSLAAHTYTCGFAKQYLNWLIEIALGKKSRIREAQARCALAVSVTSEQCEKSGREGRNRRAVVPVIDVRYEMLDFGSASMLLCQHKDLHRIALPRCCDRL